VPRKISAPVNQAVLHHFTTYHFNLDELMELCLEFGINHEEITGNNLSTKTFDERAWIDLPLFEAKIRYCAIFPVPVERLLRVGLSI